MLIDCSIEKLRKNIGGLHEETHPSESRRGSYLLLSYNTRKSDVEELVITSPAEIHGATAVARQGWPLAD